ncbi:MAG: hypothetical protein ACE148_05730 [Vicinamibacterales bacterium]
MSYLVTALAVLLVAWLPGALVFRLPVAERSRRAGLDLDERLFWEVMIALSLSSVMAVALAFCGRYSLEALLAVNAALSLAVVLAWRSRLRLGASAGRARWTLAIPLALAVVGALLFFPPAEHVIGGKDPGVYVNEGIQIAKLGGLVIRDQTVADVPARLRDLFFPSHDNPTYYGIRFMGFRILDPAEGTVVGQFPHLYPIWIAVGYGIGGLTGALQVTGLWATLGLIALYVAGKRVAGAAASGAAAGLLGISVVQIWFAREPNSEVVAQPLILAAIAAFTFADERHDRFFAALSGVLFGLLLFLRLFDAVIALAGIALALVLLMLDRRRPMLSFLVPLTLVGGLGAVYLAQVMTAYVELPAIFLNNFAASRTPVVAALVLAAAALAVLAARRPALRDALKDAVPWLMAAVLSGSAIYAYFFRQPVGRLAWHDAASLRTFAWYLPPAGIAAAVAGYVLLTWRRFWSNTAWLTCILVSSLVVFYKIRVVPEHFWMTRRFLPLILPAALLLLCGLAFISVTRRAPQVYAPGAGRRWLTGIAVPVLFLGLVGGALARASRAVLQHVEYRGVVPRLETLAARFRPDDLLVVESRNASDMHVLALPLAYVFDRNVLVLNTPKPDKLMFVEFLRQAQRRYNAVYFLGGGGTDLLSRSIRASATASERFQVPEYDSPVNSYPSGVRFKEFDFGIYRFEPTDGRAVPDESSRLEIDVGSGDDLHVVRFHAKERTGENGQVSFRWTRDVSYISLPGMAEGATKLTIWASDGGRPFGAQPAVLRMWLDDEPLGQTMVSHGFRAYEFAVPPSVANAASRREEPALLKLSVSTWSPKQLLGSQDDRQLGVMLDRVEVK